MFLNQLATASKASFPTTERSNGISKSEASAQKTWNDPVYSYLEFSTARHIFATDKAHWNRGLRGVLVFLHYMYCL